MPFSSANAISSLVLPTPEKTIFFGATPTASARRSSPSETTSMPAPSAGQRGEHAEIGIGLDRIADERVGAGEGLGEDAVMALERRGRIAIEGRADRRGKLG